MKRAYVILVCFFFVPLAAAQLILTPTGTPPFTSTSGGPFDRVNEGSLNVHFAVPVLHKAGRGLPFNYDLTYDSTIWAPVGVSGSQTWKPITNGTYWGWQGLINAGSPYIGYSMITTSAPCGQFSYQSWSYNNFVYHDAFGTAHPFGASGLYFVSPGPPSCPPYGAQPVGTQSTTATDGSGLIINVSYGQGTVSAYITTASGAIITPPVYSNSSSGTLIAKDANGNKITVAGGTYADTLGTAPLTVTGTLPSNTLLSYPAPGGTAMYTVSYTSYTVHTNFGCSGIGEDTETNISLVDKITLPDNSFYQFTYEVTPNDVHSPHYVTGRLASVTLPTGGSITYAYRNLLAGSNGIICADGTTAGLVRTLSPGGQWTYDRSFTGGNNWGTTINTPNSDQTVVSFYKDGATTNNTNNYYETQRKVYQGGSTVLHLSNTCYNGVLSPCPGTVSTPIRRVTVFNYLPDTTGVESETDTTYDAFGLVNEVDEYGYGAPGGGSPGALIKKTITAYAVLGNGIVDRPSSVTIQDGGNAVKAYTSYGYDETGVTAMTGTTPQHDPVTGFRGNLTSVKAQTSSSPAYLYRKYTYYDTGLLKTSTDVSTTSGTNGAATTYNYSATNNADCGNSFVTSITEPVGSMSRSMAWDCNGGVLTQLTDENGKLSSTAYSGTNYTNLFWRPYSTTDEAGNGTNYVYFVDGSNHEYQTESKLSFNGGNSVIDKVTTNDGLGRTIFSQTRQGPSATNYDTVATCYDNVGRVNLTTLPYSTTIASGSTPCPSANAGTSFVYDAYGRQSTVTDSGGGSTTYSYPKNDVLQTKTSPTQSKQSEFDALGRLASVCEITSGTGSWPSGACGQNTGATGYLTTYAYDLLGNLTSVTQNAQAASAHQSRGYVYDMLGRLISETNPETNNASGAYVYDSLSSDASCGTITSAGNLLKHLDPAGNAACYSSYDALHRVGIVTYPSSSTPAKHFVYDAATVNGIVMANAKTRLAEAYTCTGTCSSKITDLGFVYSALGQQIEAWESTPHSGGYYHPTQAYWPNGAPKSLWISLIPTISYGADGEGRTSTVSATSGQNPITSVTYNPASQVTAMTYGSSDSDAFTFDSNTGRMSQYQFSMGNVVKTDTGVPTWNSNGTLQQLVVTDQINAADAQTCTYTYDTLGRVGSANCGTAIFNQNFSYDPFGNITKTVPTGSTGTAFQPSYDYTNYTNRMSSSPFTYNANNGALTADSSHGYGWDTANRLSTVDNGTANGICITYDALDRVVEQAKGSACATSPTSTTEIVYSPSGAKFALMNGSALTKAFVPLVAGAQAVYNGSGLQYYRHADWLGSSRLATKPDRTLYFDGAYAPFGENYAASGTQDLSFTGQNQDTESSVSGGAGGLYDFMYRKQSPVQGRWLSPDPAGLGAANPSDPQSWNRYAYVGNRALNSTDALGLYYGSGNCSDPIYAQSHAECPVPPCIAEGTEGCIPPPPGYPWGGGGGSGGGGGGGGGGSPPPPQRKGGVWLGNETLGLPKGLNIRPATLADLFGLSPGSQCGDFVGCGSLAPVGALGISTADTYPAIAGCAITPGCQELLITAAIFGGTFILVEAGIDAVRHVRCEHQYERDLNVCRSLPVPAARARCYDSAENRRVRCEQGWAPLPPLITW